MKNSIKTNVIEIILNEIKNSQKNEDISNRIESTKEKFLAKKMRVISSSKFNDEISAFVQLVFAEGIQPPRILSPKRSLAEAIWLLDTGYKSDGLLGYYAALIDAINPCNSKFEIIIHNLAGTIRNIELYRYTEYLISTLINPTDIDMHQKIIDYFLDKQESILPNNICKENSCYFLTYYRDFIDINSSTENLLNKLTSPNNFNS